MKNMLLIDAAGKMRPCIVQRILRRQYGPRHYKISHDKRIWFRDTSRWRLYGHMNNIETFARLLTLQAEQV